MKILVIQDRLRSGGTERHSVFLTKAFSAEGHQSRLLTFRPSGALSDTAAGVLEASLQPFDTGLDWFAPGLFNRVSDFHPDVLLTMGRMANSYGSFLQKRFPKCAVIATMRTGKALPWLYKRTLRTARHVIANSQQSASGIIEGLALDPSRVSVIHNSLVFAPRPRLETGSTHATLRAEMGADRHTVVLLCIAMFRKEKNQRELIEIANCLPRNKPWQLWLGGDGPERASCEELAKKLGLADRIRFLGFLKDPQSVYRASDVAVLTSRKESLSNFLIEAQAHGLPAVAYDAQGVKECLVDGETGHVVPMGNQTDFLKRLEEFQDDRDERLRFAAAARIHAQEAFSAERQVKAYLDLFRRLLEPSAAGA